MRRLADRTALVTGASRGLGRALALALAAEGASLVLSARRPGAVDAAVAEVTAAGGSALGVAADLGDPAQVERLAATALDRLGAVDILVNNASELGPTPLPHLADAPSAALRRVLDVNVVGPFLLTKAVLGPMLLRRRGVVVNVTSDAAVEGYPGWGIYGASKAALDGLTRAWSAEVGDQGVRVVAVDPGDMDTDMHRAAIPDADPAELRRPEDVAAVMVELLVAGFPRGARVTASLPG